jgi:hypothetical protein
MVPDDEPYGEEDGDCDGICEQPPPRRHQQWHRVGYEEQEHNLEGHSSRHTQLLNEQLYLSIRCTGSASARMLNADFLLLAQTGPPGDALISVVRGFDVNNVLVYWSV